MGAYQYFTDLIEAHRQEREDRLRKEIAQARKKARAEAEEQARRENRWRYDEALRQLGHSEEEIQKIHSLSAGLGPPPPHFPR